MKKFTKATLKSILKNKKCSILIRSRFNGMTDSVERVDSTYIEIDKSKIDFTKENTFGVPGLWLVGGSRNLFTIPALGFVEIYNCCGTCIIKYE